MIREDASSVQRDGFNLIIFNLNECMVAKFCTTTVLKITVYNPGI